MKCFLKESYNIRSVIGVHISDDRRIRKGTLNHYDIHSLCMRAYTNRDIPVVVSIELKNILSKNGSKIKSPSEKSNCLPIVDTLDVKINVFHSCIEPICQTESYISVR